MNYERVRTIYQREGFKTLLYKSLFTIYRQLILTRYERYITPRLPQKSATYNGVTTKAARLFDSIVPGRQRDRPYYESGLVAALKEEVQTGDDVVIIGGGWGVTAVHAANMVGDTGTVTVFEGSASEIETLKETIALNGVNNRVNVYHSVVGKEISLRGDAADANRRQSGDIPSCDVLELDCEGSEVGILENLSISPRSIIVETHGMNGAPPDRIRELLRNNSYTVQSEVIADEGGQVRGYCELNNIYVLTARQTDARHDPDVDRL